MPLIYRTVQPKKVSNGKLELKGKRDSEYIAVNNETLVNVLRQLASVVTHAGDIFSDVASLTEQVGKRVRSVKLRLDELEAKADLFDPRLVPVPEGTLDDISKTCLPHHHRLHGDCDPDELLKQTTTNLLSSKSRPRFLIQLYDNAGNHHPVFPPRSPILSSRRSLERQISADSRRPASFAALRDWKLDDYLDDKIATLDRKKQSADQLNRALASPFPSQVVQVDVTGAGFDRMKANRRSLVVHTKKIRRNKRRNTICGSMPNKECGIQTSFTSVASPGATDDDGSRGSSRCTGEQRSDENSTSIRGLHKHNTKTYGIDSGHWSSSCTSSARDDVIGGVGGVGTTTSTCSAPSPWDPNSLTASSDFLFDDEDRCLTPQLENFTDGLVSDSDSVDTDGYFTSFRSDCGFPRMKKSASNKDLEELIAKDQDIGSLASSGGEVITDSTVECGTGKGSHGQRKTEKSVVDGSQFNAAEISNGSLVMSPLSLAGNQKALTIAENEYELFGKGSTSTTASSCGTVVLRNKPEPPQRTSSSVITAPENDLSKEQQSCGSSCNNEDAGLEERVKRKSLIERVPSLVVVTPSPSCSSESPPPLKDPGMALALTDDGSFADDSEHDSGRLTPKADDLFTTNESECGTLSDTDSDRRTEVRLSDIAIKKRSSSSTSSTGTASTNNSTLTLTGCAISACANGGGGGLPQPDVIPAEAVVQQMQIIRTAKATPRLDTNKEYYALDTVLLGSFEEELMHNKKSQSEQQQSNMTNNESSKNEMSMKSKDVSSPTPQATLQNGTASSNSSTNGVAISGKIKGARVVLDANGEIIFSSETLRRKRKQKVSFDPGAAVKSPDYDSNSTYARVRESVYDRIRKDPGEQEKLYECIEEIRKHNLKPRDPFLEAQQLKQEKNESSHLFNGRSGSSASLSGSSIDSSSSPSKSCSSTPEHHNSSGGLLETDLDSAIPPVMPDLKNLPKIKDRLKRNESYRIANTDDVPRSAAPTSPVSPQSRISNGTSNGIKGSNPNRSPLSPLHLNRNGLSSLTKRMSLTGSPRPLADNHRVSSPTPLHLNKKRDIPEEDPNFIQQIFNMNTAANNQLNNHHVNGGVQNSINGGNTNNRSSSLLKTPTDNCSSPSSRAPLSKFTLSAEDKPSFLRRDSPPTMDEIAKEIYRFRKKFNIQPNSATTTLTGSRPSSTTPTSSTTLSASMMGSAYGGSIRRVPLPPNRNSPMARPIPRSSSSLDYGSSAPTMQTAQLPRSTTNPSIVKSTIPAGFPKLSLRQSQTPTSSPSPLSSSTPIRSSFSIATTKASPIPKLDPVSVNGSSIHRSGPSYAWHDQSPMCSTPVTRAQSAASPYATLQRTPPCTPPTPPTRAFISMSAANRKIFPFSPTQRPNSVAESTTAHHRENYYSPSTTNQTSRPHKINEIQNGFATTNPLTAIHNDYESTSSLRNKSLSLLPSLPFRRNSVAFTETNSYSPALKPRTSIGEFKKLLQATQKKRSSISAVEVLKPKGLETTL